MILRKIAKRSFFLSPLLVPDCHKDDGCSKRAKNALVYFLFINDVVEKEVIGIQCVCAKEDDGHFVARVFLFLKQTREHLVEDGVQQQNPTSDTKSAHSISCTKENSE